MSGFRPWHSACVVAAAIAVALTGLDVVTPTASAATYIPPAARQQTNLDAGWRFLRSDAANAQNTGFDDSTWSAITVPHTWNAKDGEDGGNNYYRGIGWYRRHYTPPTALAGQKLWLQFDGADTVTDVWVNGTHLGQHQGGYARFLFDATSALVLGSDNVIAVKVSNAADPNVAPLSADYTFFGGIYRDVSLVTTNPLQVRVLDYGGPGVYLRQRAVTTTSATVDVTTKAWNNNTTTRNARIRTVITDATGTVVADASTASKAMPAGSGYDTTQTITIGKPRLWNGKADAYLYHATVEVQDADSGAVTDVVSQPLGLRSYSVDPDNGLSLDGQHLALHGVNAHQDRRDKGWAVSPADRVQDFDLMDEMGANALRTAHYQQSQQVYDLADQRGYLVWAEIPLVNNITDSAQFTANAQQQLRELIRQNYNHPSILFWGIGNEQRVDDAATNTLLDSLAGIVKQEDPDRLSTYANCCVSQTGAVPSHSAVVGYNEYFGWYSGATTDFGAWADNLHKALPARDIAVSEYGAGSNTAQHQENPPKPSTTGNWHPEEYQSLVHESMLAQIKTRPYLWGTFVWNMFDFASDGRAEGGQPGLNDKGLVTYDRKIKKDSFYLYKANWTQTPFVHLDSSRWTDRTAATTTVKVYGTVDDATLTVNGVQVGGTLTATNHIYSWPNVNLAKGVNTVKVTGQRDGQTYTDTAVWTLA